MKCILSTTEKGGVAITIPTVEIMAFLTAGGMPTGYLGRTLDADWEVEKFVRDEKWHPSLSSVRRETLAAQWIEAVMFGGLTDAKAYELIQRKDVDDSWSAHELLDRSEVPQDRWFRNAWVRSRNGGPIDIDLKRARPIQRQRVTTAVAEERARRANDPDLFLMPVECDDVVINRQIVAARSVEELRSVWPIELGQK